MAKKKSASRRTSRTSKDVEEEAPADTTEQQEVKDADEEDLDALWNEAPRIAMPQPAPVSESSESSDEEEEAQASPSSREEAAPLPANRPLPEVARAAKSTLPSALDAFRKVTAPPSFLNPEAIRPLASVTLRMPGDAGNGAAQGPAASRKGREKIPGDISRMAPKLKEDRASQPGVIMGNAVRNRDTGGAGEISAAHIAMLGGQAEKVDRGKAVKAMDVAEFLDKGGGGAALPRKRQDRKEREKDKRARGQSTHANWKSEAEMVLRQQFD